MIKLSVKTRVYDSLVTHSPAAARLFEKTFHHPVREQEPGPRLLINDLNQYWRVQLGSLSIDTINARSALIDTDNFEEWHNLFTQYVLPVAVSGWITANGGSR